ncbi:MAG: hypothetical protein JOZ60_00420 [Verrucomicrobia bacterium]|nr:hypothetical protein [Verrucomicrobiota bacterium]
MTRSFLHKWQQNYAISLSAQTPAVVVYRLLNPLGFAAGQLAVFQGASDEHIQIDTRGASNAEKQPTGRGPEGCVENGPAAALLVGYVSL